jgi:hypothetical protein
MHLKLVLTAGAATASLVAGTAGTVLLGHAASSPSSQHTTQPTPHHISAPNHAGGTKGRQGYGVQHHRGTGGHVNGRLAPKHHHKHKPMPTGTPAPTPTPHP